jgi:hypothetical protein
MKKLIYSIYFITAFALFPLPCFAETPTVVIENGQATYRDPSGHKQRIGAPGTYTEAVLSPDGKMIAALRTTFEPKREEDGPRTNELWIADIPGKNTRRIAPHQGTKPQEEFLSLRDLVFSADGSKIYLIADAWATSGAIHEVDAKTGKERFVTDGNSLLVAKNGPFRGMLLISKHEYLSGGGSKDPYYIIQPTDGSKKSMIPGTDHAGDNDLKVQNWLKENHWAAE